MKLFMKANQKKCFVVKVKFIVAILFGANFYAAGHVKKVTCVVWKLGGQRKISSFSMTSASNFFASKTGFCFINLRSKNLEAQ